MSTHQSPQETPDEGARSAPTTPASPHLPSVRTDLPPAEILRKLDAAARRGKLGGFTPGQPGGAGDTPLFTVRDVGTPFEGEVAATLSGGELRFTTRLYRRMPMVLVIILIVSVWPGVWLMESLMNVYWPSVGKYTWWWYLPLTIISGPPAYFGAMKRSRAVLYEDAVKVIESVEKGLR